MTNYRLKNLEMKYGEVYLGKRLLTKIEAHQTYEKMFYVVWPDGIKSKDVYNRSRAKMHAADAALEILANEGHTIED